MNDELNKQTKAHLWKPGQSGNPKGRAKRVKSIADILHRIGKEMAPELLQEAMRKTFGLTKPITMEEAVLRRVYIDAAKGDMKAVEFIADRTEGKALQRIANDGDTPFVVVVPQEPDVKDNDATEATSQHV